MKQVYSIILFLISTILHAQCPSVTCQPALTLTNCAQGETLVATSNYSTNITSRWIGPGNIPIASVGTATSVVNINHIGTYTVEFKDNTSNCIVMDSVHVNTSLNKPTFSLLVTPSYSLICTTSSVVISITNANNFPVPGGPVSYTITGPPTSTTFPNGVLGSSSMYTISTCGIWTAHVKDNVNNCLSSFSFPICCPTLTTQVLNVTGNNTVCQGSSMTFSTNGSNLLWSNGATTSTLNTIPLINTLYSVTGLDANNCPSSGSIVATVNTTCADVWPGDANRDGQVTSTDVLELGLAANNTGPARNSVSNVWASQFANAWTGSISSGWNKAHADCNGDGTVNQSDTLAIFNNFSLTHSFKPSDTSTNPDITLVSPEGVGAMGWNFADIELGNSLTAPISQLYGIAFDLNYDKNLIVQDSAYIVYYPSFLNSANQNIEFRKPDFTNGKIYAASVRTDGSNVSGSGVIGQFWFKVNSGYVNHTPLNLSISNVTKIDKSGISTVLAGGSTQVDLLIVGISELENFKNSIYFYPNPAQDKLFASANGGQKVNYSILDISGREITNGDYIDSKIIDLTGYSAGTYILRFESKNLTAYKKLVLEK